MNAKKVLGFVLCSSAFTKRNLSSLGLVLAFLFMYVLAGGKIETKLPSPSKVGAFGESEEAVGIKRKNSEQVLGITPSKERASREDSTLERGRIFANEEASELEPINKDLLIKNQRGDQLSNRDRVAIQNSQKQERDPLLAIEERLGKNPK